MRAAILHRQGAPLTVEEVDLDPPRAGEVLVRLVASGVCHSCLHAADGSWSGILTPIVLGDEGAGVVEAVGPGVETVRPGDHVILSWAPACGRCRFCVQGRPVLCERKPPRFHLADGTTRLRWRGQPVYHYGHVATFATHSVVPASSAIPIPPDIPLDRAVLIGCSVMTGVGAVLNTARVPAGASMAVFGVGGIGLNVVQGGALASAWPIIGVDIHDHKLAYARQFGLTHTVNARQTDPVAAIQEITQGRGADFTFVAVGDTGAVAQAIAALAPGGTCVLIGVPPSGQTVPLDPAFLVTRERRVIGSSYGSARTWLDFPRLLDLYRAGRLRLDELITHRYRLEEVNEAFRALAAGEVARAILVFD